jgi:hypothetical protein
MEITNNPLHSIAERPILESRWKRIVLIAEKVVAVALGSFIILAFLKKLPFCLKTPFVKCLAFGATLYFVIRLILYKQDVSAIPSQPVIQKKRVNRNLLHEFEQAGRTP